VRTIRTIDEVQAALAGSGSIGLVPTMGALHDGHLSLFRAARAENGTVVASLFVNPAQFDDEADLGAYPRDEARDAELAAKAGVDLLFAPSLEEMYPADFRTWVEVEEVSAGLEGDARPGHFRAVATVCLKLFNIVRPARAYFGLKDAQQAAVIRRLVRDLNLPLAIRVLPTVRDVDGLALSSRNTRLSAEERARALALPRALARGAETYRLGGDAVAAARAELNGLTADYVELLDLDGALVLAGAARVGSIRLIDNVLLDLPSQASAWLGPTTKGELR
jgi:pantoate--beta-alanine ligase